MEKLIEHYNKQAKMLEAVEKTLEDFKTHKTLVNAIKKQNKLLGRNIKTRALELLRIASGKKDNYGRSIGLPYQDVLNTLKEEFPEAHTSIACLRWYIAHVRIEANDQGTVKTDLPGMRPRSYVKKQNTDD